MAGIGRGLVAAFLSQPKNAVIAGVRNLQSEETVSLRDLPAADGSHLILVKLDNTSSTDVGTAVRHIQSEFGIQSIDIAISNAGICDHLLPAADMDLNELHKHVDTNAYGVLRLFQGLWPMLRESPAPKFICISSGLGSISLSASNDAAIGAYGLSKAAANYLIAKIGAENPSLVAFSIDPGLVQTDMGNRGARFAGLEVAPVTIQQSVEGIVREIEISSRSRNNGRFTTYNGKTIPW
ncbi:hypothetical protein OPT61_g2834 [Boeremia exigua]|uniref:Uncharacterized protein n=1 Tax=Boeremia exigua TaxID=749465 RepID=A0ACC2IK16_9PLEO|nr:hypothetical protein OPT61_g2834 [Boeremia exigua]